jgi:hypothetical protein
MTQDNKPELSAPYRQGFSTGYDLGLAVGAMAEACRSEITNYSDIVPDAHFEHMHHIAATLNHSLVMVERMPVVASKRPLIRVEIRRINDSKGNATVHLKPMPAGVVKVST